MARRTFFSFYFQRDAWRVSQVRNSNIVQAEVDGTPYLDKADWEKVQRDEGIKSWIDRQLSGTSVTVVLIGTQTYGREWVNYEIDKSWRRANGMIGIFIHGIRDQSGASDQRGRNPFSWFNIGSDQSNSMAKYVRLYDWVLDDGRSNMGKWIERSYEERSTRPVIYQQAPA